jgi:predicted transcriptional regulator
MQEDHEPSEPQSLAELTASIASAYVSHNRISAADLARLITDTGRELQSLGGQAPVPERPEPAVSVRRSIGRDHLTCLVCGKQQRLLKRHLAVEHELTPAAYRQTFGLKSDYPMAAPSYTERRRALALEIGLGRPKKPARKRKAAAPKKGARARREG